MKKHPGFASRLMAQDSFSQVGNLLCDKQFGQTILGMSAWNLLEKWSYFYTLRKNLESTFVGLTLLPC